MARYIDLDKYDTFDCDVEICDGNYCTDCYYSRYDGAEDVAPVIHAKWEWSYYKDGYVCSNCEQECAGTRFGGDSYFTPYCPFCGAKMNWGS